MSLEKRDKGGQGKTPVNEPRHLVRATNSKLIKRGEAKQRKGG